MTRLRRVLASRLLGPATRPDDIVRRYAAELGWDDAARAELWRVWAALPADERACAVINMQEHLNRAGVRASRVRAAVARARLKPEEE